MPNGDGLCSIWLSTSLMEQNTKKTLKRRITGSLWRAHRWLPSQRASNSESVFMSWHIMKQNGALSCNNTFFSLRSSVYTPVITSRAPDEDVLIVATPRSRGLRQEDSCVPHVRTVDCDRPSIHLILVHKCHHLYRQWGRWRVYSMLKGIFTMHKCIHKHAVRPSPSFWDMLYSSMKNTFLIHFLSMFSRLTIDTCHKFTKMIRLSVMQLLVRSGHRPTSTKGSTRYQIKYAIHSSSVW